MIKQPRKAPKLRCSAAQLRALIGFGRELAVEFFTDPGSPVEEAARVAMVELHRCYMSLSAESIVAQDWQLNSREIGSRAGNAGGLPGRTPRGAGHPGPGSRATIIAGKQIPQQEVLRDSGPIFAQQYVALEARAARSLN